MAYVHFGCLLKEAICNGHSSAAWERCSCCRSTYTGLTANELACKRLRTYTNQGVECIQMFGYLRAYFDVSDEAYDKELVKNTIDSLCGGKCAIYYSAQVEYHCFLSKFSSTRANLTKAARYLDNVMEENKTQNQMTMSTHMTEALAHAYYVAWGKEKEKDLMEKAILLQLSVCADRTIRSELYYHSMCNLVGYQCLYNVCACMQAKAETLKDEIQTQFGVDHNLSKQVNDMCVFIQHHIV